MINFNIVSIDASLLGIYLNAKNGIGSSSFSFPTSSSFNRGPAVITPWAETDDSSLLSRYNKIRNKTNFINENTSAVKEAGFDKDNKALFTLYSALNDLRTIAEYAASDKTSSNLIAGLSTQFQTGLAQIDQYVRTAELDKLILMAGQKKSFLISETGLGKDDRDIQGLTVATVSEASAIVGLNGDEVFTINIDTISDNDDITIDLSEISGTVSLEAIKDLINAKIIAVTTVNGDGETVGKYKTRVSVEELSDGKFSLKFDVDGIEKLSFSAASADPALIIAGTTRSGEFGSITEGTLDKYDNLSGGDLKTAYSTEITGIDENGYVIPADKDDEDAEDTASTIQTFNTTPTALKTDSQGNTFVLGTTEGDIGGQINGAKTQDVFLSKFDSTGNLLWSRLLGASDDAEAFAIVIDSEDNVIIAGKTNEELISSDVFSGTDSFVTKYSHSGEEIWTQQLDKAATDQANGLTVDADDNVYFTGQISGQVSNTETHEGGNDVLIVKLSANTGTIVGTAQFGSASDEYGMDIAIASDGNLLVLTEEDGHAVVRKLDKLNLDSTLASYDLGDLGGGTVSGFVVDGDDIYLSGSTYNGSLNGGSVVGSYNDGKDGFITKLTDTGSGFTANWTSYVGTDAADKINDITVDNGVLYVAGTTSGTLSGESKTGITDGFAASFDAATGAALWHQQFGGEVGGYNESTAISIAANGSSVLDQLGLPTGTVDNTQTRNLETQTSLRKGDYFSISVNGGRNIKIDIRDGDTFDILARRINTYSTSNLKASVTIGENGPALKLEAKNGAEIEFIAGADGRDALSKLGIEERSILSANVLFDLDASKEIDPEDLGGVFALGLNNGFSFSTTKEAEYILKQLDFAIRVIQSAHRSLTFDPIRAKILQDSKNNVGPAPAFMQDRLARYQDGLRRVLAVTGGTFI